jgi:hypothetical protein
MIGTQVNEITFRNGLDTIAGVRENCTAPKNVELN